MERIVLQVYAVDLGELHFHPAVSREWTEI